MVACHQLQSQLALFIWKYLWPKVNVLATNDRLDVNTLQKHEPHVAFSHSISQPGLVHNLSFLSVESMYA